MEADRPVEIRMIGDKKLKAENEKGLNDYPPPKPKDAPQSDPPIELPPPKDVPQDPPTQPGDPPPSGKVL